MKTRLLRLALTFSLASFSLFAVGCGEEATDPAGDPTPDMNPAPNPDPNPAPNNDPNPDMPDPNPDMPDPNPDMPDPNPDMPDPNPDPNPDTPGDCQENVTYLGQVFPGEDDDVPNPNGGVPSFEPYTNDAGLGALCEAFVGLEEDADLAVDNLVVTSATVTASSFNSANQPVPRANRDFWLADANCAVKVFFLAEDTEQHVPFNIKVGQQISVTVTQITNFRGGVEITGVAADSWALDTEGNDVFIDDRTGGNIDLTDINKVVRVTGTLQDNGEACGDPSLCFQLNYGGNTDIILRTRPSQFIDTSQGSCVTFVGPVNAFGGNAQLDVVNFTWLADNNFE